MAPSGLATANSQAVTARKGCRRTRGCRGSSSSPAASVREDGGVGHKDSGCPRAHRCPREGEPASASLGSRDARCCGREPRCASRIPAPISASSAEAATHVLRGKGQAGLSKTRKRPPQRTSGAGRAWLRERPRGAPGQRPVPAHRHAARTEAGGARRGTRTAQGNLRASRPDPVLPSGRLTPRRDGRPPRPGCTLRVPPAPTGPPAHPGGAISLCGPEPPPAAVPTPVPPPAGAAPLSLPAPPLTATAPAPPAPRNAPRAAPDRIEKSERSNECGERPRPRMGPGQPELGTASLRQGSGPGEL